MAWIWNIQNQLSELIPDRGNGNYFDSSQLQNKNYPLPLSDLIPAIGDGNHSE
ncbi:MULTISPECIES: hypothetical protein [Leptolyngbya]|uniref:hypothetical protein n=1 Tax=Leptolyngbya TaxID=47251 RepID=UPI001687D413|nr:hypothetical protein [Leptolyngbya sp. FACHB-1624]MBD1858248.1 hypothetical protein [Leptolyngbya sp. FACHB-1624]